MDLPGSGMLTRTPPNHETRAQTLKPADCEVVCCSMADIRAALGIQCGGAAALSVVAMLSGSGAWGVVSAGVDVGG